MYYLYYIVGRKISVQEHENKEQENSYFINESKGVLLFLSSHVDKYPAHMNLIKTIYWQKRWKLELSLSNFTPKIYVYSPSKLRQARPDLATMKNTAANDQARVS